MKLNHSAYPLKASFFEIARLGFTPFVVGSRRVSVDFNRIFAYRKAFTFGKLNFLWKVHTVLTEKHEHKPTSVNLSHRKHILAIGLFFQFPDSKKWIQRIFRVLSAWTNA